MFFQGDLFDHGVSSPFAFAHDLARKPVAIFRGHAALRPAPAEFFRFYLYRILG
jgi:hypothetical protein